MKTSTMAGVMTGGVLGMAIGASLMMMPQNKQMKRVLAKGANGMKKSISNMMHW